MKDKILFESKYFWVDDQFQINLHAGNFSLNVGRKKTLAEAIAFIEKVERYPKNIKYLVEPEYRYYFN